MSSMAQKIIALVAIFSTVKSQYNCSAGVSCTIDCSTQSCNGVYYSQNVIDASLATGLTVTCGTAASCEYTKIILPSSSTSTSSITCSASLACYDLTIGFYGDATSSTEHEINLDCTTIDDSCYYVTIDAEKAGLYILALSQYYLYIYGLTCTYI